MIQWVNTAASVAVLLFFYVLISALALVDAENSVLS
jgi:hypothetical protein